MPAHQVTISVDGISHRIVPGLVPGDILLALAPLDPSDQLLFEVDGDMDIPVSSTDMIVLTGGETFSIGDGCPRISDNPTVRKAPQLIVNDQESELDQHPQHAKLTGAEIKARSGTQAGVELWLDLKGLADERVGDAQRVILRDGYTFFTKALDQNGDSGYCQHEAKPVHVTVNGATHEIPVGHYPVAELKRIFSVLPDYEFDQVTDGKFTSLNNESVIFICGGEIFVGHVRQGASS